MKNSEHNRVLARESPISLRVVQLDFTPEIKVLCVLFHRSLPILTKTPLKHVIKYFSFRCNIQLDLPVQLGKTFQKVLLSRHVTWWTLIHRKSSDDVFNIPHGRLTQPDERDLQQPFLPIKAPWVTYILLAWCLFLVAEPNFFSYACLLSVASN